MIEIVFFDAGETILSPQPSWSGLSAQVLTERGHSVAPEAMQQAWRDVGPRFREVSEDGRQFSLTHDASKRFWTSLYGEILERLAIDDPGAPVVLYETFSNPQNYRLFPDARPCLQTLHERGVRLGIISNFESWLRRLLQTLGVLDLFDTIAISGDLGWEKPDPRIFEWALREARVEPAAAAYVGDQPFFDAEPATRCGMLGVLLDRFARYAGAEADYPTIRSLAELPDLVHDAAARRS